jgi:hypothetical protein
MLAVFVEGNTEALYVDKLIEEIAGRNSVIIEHRKILGGSRVKRRVETIRAAKPTNGQQYYVLLYDCGGDESVKTRIKEEHENLTKSGYSRIIGLRDVRPDFTYADIPQLETNLPRFINTSWIPVTFILAIMEIEAWFLSEATHFQRIYPCITVAAIIKNLGFDPENDDMEQRSNPAEDLNNCYQIGRRTYSKRQAQVTINVLDYSLIYLEHPARNRYLKQLIAAIDAFLT